jgi:Raf kinase inhibitor-like YbhB/YbcL family protein
MKTTSLALLALLASAPASAFELGSGEIADGKPMSVRQEFKGFGCDGQNLAPSLNWSGAPSGTKSFAVTVYDPDAPTGSGWWHWVAYDIPATVAQLPEGGALPAGAKEGRTDFGNRGFGGACPPVGDKPHHYIFTVYALKVEKLDVSPDASAALIGYMLHANSLGSATLTATFAR